MSLTNIKALLFDTFGTVTDWRTSTIADFRAFGARKGMNIDWEKLVDEWKTAYRPGMDAVRTGQVALDESGIRIYRMKLDEILPAYGLSALSEAERVYLNRAWHRIHAWPDAVDGLVRLKKRYVISPLSNGDVDCLVAMAKHAGLPWDVILCAEIFRHYKPDAEAYLGALELLNLEPSEVMMVAAHNYDLRAARSHGMRTGFVTRRTEYGPGQKTDLEAEEKWDVIANDFRELASALGC